jgi:hypothetical protein
MAALNYQNFDKSMQINRGFFMQNGNCGYLLKPADLKNQFDENRVNYTLRVVLLSGYCLPKPHGKHKGEIIDPFVKITLFTPSENPNGDVNSEKKQSKHVEDNGFNPIWGNAMGDNGYLFEQKVFVFL